MNNWQQVLKELKYQYLERTTPAFFTASGGRTMKLPPYTDKTTNGLTNAICDYLKFKGCYSNRVNSTGIMRKINGEMKFTYSNTNRGTADITAIIGGRHVAIEVKCKATKDRVSKEQVKEKKRIEDAGGLYHIAGDMQSFIEWYQQNFEAQLLIK